METPIKAYGGNGAAVIYEFSNGTGVMRCGGKIGWRSTNPGNITTGKLSKEFGFIGNNGRFVIFPDFATGKQAIFKLLQRNYLNFTLEEAFYAYAPPNENDTEAYINFVVVRTGYKRTDPMKTLDLRPIVEAIITKEGYLNPANQGDIKFIPDVTKKQRYIWRTRKDIKVRKEHRAREGKIFYWNNPPEDEHPGEAYGCRCWAEAFEYEECFEKVNPRPTHHGFQIHFVTGGAGSIQI
ncbi:MAG: hypothetical protein COV67_02625 [Nitrospinae bacterium CG11_big_fil_rev_8_21_14_0_20_56_8]|nr:MAG: hypothetical protein COV67_02625 [Nitrospinae bacterium CG11_big_fil_rev_8_21_14_0_20_56_8]